MSVNVLYTFRRCPYAMRARVTLRAAQATVGWREILLKDKPSAMLEASPKGTVPVLVLADGTVIDESRDVMKWAIDNSTSLPFDAQWQQSRDWLDRNDDHFKYWLDRYKYSVGYPEHTEGYYREQAEQFIQLLEDKLANSPYLLGDEITAADLGVFPFVRQFAMVDQGWFFSSHYTNVQTWLSQWLEHPWFTSVMHKRDPWQEGDEEVYL